MKKVILALALLLSCLSSCKKVTCNDTLAGSIFEATVDNDYYRIEFFPVEHGGKRYYQLSDGHKGSVKFEYLYNHPELTVKEGSKTTVITVDNSRNSFYYNDILFKRKSLTHSEY